MTENGEASQLWTPEEIDLIRTVSKTKDPYIAPGWEDGFIPGDPTGKPNDTDELAPPSSNIVPMFTDKGPLFKGVKVRGELINELIRGRPIDIGDGEGPVVIDIGDGLYLRGVWVTTAISMVDARDKQGNALPILSLVGCRLEEGIDICFSLFHRLTLTDCRLPFLNAEGVTISKRINLSGIRPLSDRSEDYCWIEFTNASLGGDLWLSKSQLIGNRALCLQGAKVEGHVFLDGVKSKGCISLYDAKIAQGISLENTHLSGLALDDGSELVFNAIGAHFGSNVSLSRGFSARGTVNLFQTRIEGDLWIYNAQLMSNSLALNCMSLLVDGSVELMGIKDETVKIEGVVSFQSARIKNDFKIAKLDITPGEGRSAMNAMDLEVGGGLQMEGCTFGGRVDLSRSSTGHNLDLSSIAIAGQAEATALAARNLEIHGHLTFSDMTVTGLMDLKWSEVGGNVECHDSKLKASGEACAFDAHAMRVKGDVHFSSNQLTAPFRTSGMRCDGTVILNDMEMSNAKSDTQGRTLIMSNMNVAGDLNLQTLKVKGTTTLETVSVETDLNIFDCGLHGELNLNGVQVGRGVRLARTRMGELDSKAEKFGSFSPEHTVRLCDARVGSVIDTTEFAGALELCRTQCATYSDGNKLHDGQLLNLNGFVYDRLNADERSEQKEQEGQAPQTHGGRFLFWGPPSPATARLAWLGQQGGYMKGRRGLLHWFTGEPALKVGRGKYAPQPFLQLATVFSKNGYEQDSIRVMQAKQWLEARQSVFPANLLRALFGVTFGFGYSAWRAFWTLLLYIVIGYAGIEAANRNDLLTVDTQAVVGYADKDRFVALNADGRGQDSMACKNTITPLFYAIDLMVPLLDLHQEGKCEVNTDIPDQELLLGTDANNKVVVPGAWITFSLQFLRAFYAILGWVVVSLSILTFSGLLRQKES